VPLQVVPVTCGSGSDGRRSLPRIHTTFQVRKFTSGLCVCVCVCVCVCGFLHGDVACFLSLDAKNHIPSFL